MTDREFTLKHVFTDVEKFKQYQTHFSPIGKLEIYRNLYSPKEEHFGVDWAIKMDRYDNHLKICLIQYISKNQEIDYNMKIVLKNKEKTCSLPISCFYASSGDRGCRSFIDWGTLENEYLDDGKLEVEVHVKIKKTMEIPEEIIGFPRKGLRSFGEDMEQVYDVILKINEHKFYVLKLYLSAHSPYFNTLFLGKFQEAEKSEIELKDVDPQDFQYYLEVLYLEDEIDDDTVEGILSVADMFDTPIIIKKCEKFLIENAEMELKKKLELAGKYRLEELKKLCLDLIKSKEDIRSVVPEDPKGMDNEILAELLKKSLAFN